MLAEAAHSDTVGSPPWVKRPVQDAVAPSISEVLPLGDVKVIGIHGGTTTRLHLCARCCGDLSSRSSVSLPAETPSRLLAPFSVALLKESVILSGVASTEAAQPMVGSLVVCESSHSPQFTAHRSLCPDCPPRNALTRESRVSLAPRPPFRALVSRMRISPVFSELTAARILGDPECVVESERYNPAQLEEALCHRPALLHLHMDNAKGVVCALRPPR